MDTAVPPRQALRCSHDTSDISGPDRRRMARRLRPQTPTLAWAQIPSCAEADVSCAVAFDGGAWPAMTATQRGALLRKLGDLIAMHAEQLAQTEVRDNGKLIAEMLGQTRYVPQRYYYFGGLADKIEGGVQSIDKPDVFKLHSTARFSIASLSAKAKVPKLSLVAALRTRRNTVRGSSSRRFSQAPTIGRASLRRRSLDRSLPSSHLRMKRRRSQSPSIPSTGWQRVCGHRACGGQR
jgi:hypothetical protein